MWHPDARHRKAPDQVPAGIVHRRANQRTCGAAARHQASTASTAADPKGAPFGTLQQHDTDKHDANKNMDDENDSHGSLLMARSAPDRTLRRLRQDPLLTNC